MDSVVWLASYPKSGNTWVRFLLAHYYLGAGEWTKIRGVVVEYMPLYLAARREGRSDAEAWRDVMDYRAEQELVVALPLIMKTHFVANDDHPFFQRTCKAITVVRHPKDVCLSALNYQGLTGHEVAEDAEYVRRFIRHQGDPSWRRVGFGTWIENVTSWLAVKRFPVLLVRYEDLHASPDRELTRILEFLQLPVDPVRVQFAAEQSSLASLRKLEVQARQEGDIRHFAPGYYFMNRGGCGQTLAHLGKGLDRRFDQTFAPCLKQVEAAQDSVRDAA